MIELNYDYDHEELRIIQKELFKLLSAFKNICDENNINYFLHGGTLLGAVRHRKFIPWDDDLDVVMKRSDFEKLHNIIDNELKTEYEIKYNGQWVPRFYVNKLMDMDLFLDIFILDDIPTNKLKYNMKLLKLKFLQGMMKRKISFKKKSFLENLFQLTTKLVGLIFTSKFKIKIYNKISRKKCESSQYYHISNDQYKFLTNKINKSYYHEFVMLEFEDDLFPCPLNWDGALKIFYGDYMVIPSIENRVPLHDNIKKKANGK